MMPYIIYATLVATVFLMNLNGFLRGANKVQTNVVLRLIIIGTIIVSFVIPGWEHGILAIGITLVSIRFTRPIAARAASKLLSVPKGKNDKYIGLPPRALERISKRLDVVLPNSPNNLDEVFRLADSAENELLDYCESQPAVKAVMEDFQVSRKDLKEIYSQIIEAGAGQWSCGHWVPASALAYPESLEYVLSRRESDIKETSFNLIMYFEHGSFGIGI
jgi:hypothetical protein